MENKIFIMEYRNIGGSWTRVWKYEFMGKKYFLRTIEFRKYAQETKAMD